MGTEVIKSKNDILVAELMEIDGGLLTTTLEGCLLRELVDGFMLHEVKIDIAYNEYLMLPQPVKFVHRNMLQKRGLRGHAKLSSLICLEFEERTVQQCSDVL
ncbi:hypothetical protein PanWU01x14_011730 [Parasponia andersonii]|uniref:Uncharacterized protein n=1 Tax=Parasponia andersonii TaxID=3476 RepID=A0A2P5E1Q3_PARAD|nr:hypothetical protein PanWU01x14_011730 [Parasponia andersonii]